MLVCYCWIALSPIRILGFLMIITIAGTVDNTGITTLALEIARAVAERINPKTRTIQAGTVLLLEADPAGGVLSDLLSDVEPEHHSSLQRLGTSAAGRLDEWPVYAWTHPKTKDMLKLLFCDRATSPAANFLRHEEKDLAKYFASRVDMVVVVDAGRVLYQRDFVLQADVVIWLVNSTHPCGIQRTINVLDEYGPMVEGEKRFGVMTGEPVMVGQLEKSLNLPIVGTLPHPSRPLGREPSTRYRHVVETIVDQILEESA